MTLGAMAKVGKRTNLGPHLEIPVSKKTGINNSFLDGAAVLGFVGMAQNIVAAPKIADIMGDDLVNHMVD